MTDTERTNQCFLPPSECVRKSGNCTRHSATKCKRLHWPWIAYVKLDVLAISIIVLQIQMSFYALLFGSIHTCELCDNAPLCLQLRIVVGRCTFWSAFLHHMILQRLQTTIQQAQGFNKLLHSVVIVHSTWCAIIFQSKN